MRFVLFSSQNYGILLDKRSHVENSLMWKDTLLWIGLECHSCDVSRFTALEREPLKWHFLCMYSYSQNDNNKNLNEIYVNCLPAKKHNKGKEIAELFDEIIKTTTQSIN